MDLGCLIRESVFRFRSCFCWSSWLALHQNENGEGRPLMAYLLPYVSTIRLGTICNVYEVKEKKEYKGKGKTKGGI